jgi:DNA-binding transcriptional MerR regulator
MRAPQVTPEGGEGPQSALERKIILEYLKSKGVNLENLGDLPKDEQQHLMREASKYASLKLAEVESRAKFRHDIHGPS